MGWCKLFVYSINKRLFIYSKTKTNKETDYGKVKFSII